MAKFGKASLAKLATCDVKLQQIMENVLERIDISVQYGHRTVQEQQKLFSQGRSFVNGRWIKTGKTVTDMDGVVKKSMHNYYPSKAIDITPYPLDWKDINAFIKVKDIVFEEANKLGIKLTWGADWDGDGNIAEHKLQDYPHYELKEIK